MLNITVNGKPHNLPGPLTVAELVVQLGFDAKRVAVEVNEKVVPRPLTANTS